MSAPRVAGALAALWLLLGAGCSTGGDTDDAGEGPATTVLVDTEEGTQAFGIDGDVGTFDWEGEGGRLEFELDGDRVLAEGADGSFEVTRGLPEGWPEQLPAPPGGRLVEGEVAQVGPVRQLTTRYETGESGEQVAAFFEEALTAGLVLVDVRDGRPETYEGTVSFEGEWTGFVWVRREAGVTHVSISVVQDP